MSIGPLPIIGSLAGGQRAQASGSDLDRTQQEVAGQARETASTQKAEQAAGIGETTEDLAAGDRDADGHRQWESADHAEPRDANQHAGQAHDQPLAQVPPEGKRGVNLDLSG